MAPVGLTSAMLFSPQFGIGAAVGHTGDMPDYTGMPAVVPSKRLSLAIVLAEGNKSARDMMSELTATLQPLLG